MNIDRAPPIVEIVRVLSERSNRGTSGRKTGGLLAKCEISLHFCKSGRKTGGLLAKCEISLHFCK